MTSYILTAIFISAIVTFFLRGAVFVVFREGRQMPAWMKSLGELLPPAIMAVLIIYCLRGIRNDLYGIGFPGIISVVVTVLTYKWKHNTFLSITVGTSLYMVLIRIVI